VRRFGRVSGFASADAERSYLEAYDAALALSPVPLETIDVPTAPWGSTRVYACGPSGAPPLVALHGKFLTSTMWLDLLPTFTASHRTYIFDAIGELGRTTTTRMLRNPAEIVGWIDAVLAALGGEPVALVGHSNGGFQSATYASARPERVERVAFLAPAATFVSISGAWWRASLPAMVGTNREKLARFWDRLSVNPEPSPLQRASDEQMLRALVGMRSPLLDAWPRTYKPARLARMTMPVLAVFGRQDLIGDADKAAAKVRDVLPHAQIEVLDDSSHMVTFDQQAMVTKLLEQFLAP
jgi:pimeloyl-ACP methyl ester carboxylesterase